MKLLIFKGGLNWACATACQSQWFRKLAAVHRSQSGHVTWKVQALLSLLVSGLSSPRGLFLQLIIVADLPSAHPYWGVCKQLSPKLFICLIFIPPNASLSSVFSSLEMCWEWRRQDTGREGSVLQWGLSISRGHTIPPSPASFLSQGNLSTLQHSEHSGSRPSTPQKPTRNRSLVTPRLPNPMDTFLSLFCTLTCFQMSS